MSWIRRAEPSAEHDCTPPMHTPTRSYPFPPGHPRAGQTYTKTLRPRPDGLYGDLWQCDECGTVWRIGYAPAPAVRTRYQQVRLVQTWLKANRLVQWRYRRREPETPTTRIGCGLRRRIDRAQRGEK